MNRTRPLLSVGKEQLMWRVDRSSTDVCFSYFLLLPFLFASFKSLLKPLLETFFFHFFCRIVVFWLYFKFPGTSDKNGSGLDLFHSKTLGSTRKGHGRINPCLEIHDMFFALCWLLLSWLQPDGLVLVSDGGGIRLDWLYTAELLIRLDLIFAVG